MGVQRSKLGVWWSVLLFCFIVFPLAETSGQVKLDLRGGLFTNGNTLSLGAGLSAPVTGRLFLNPTIEYLFIENTTTLFLSVDMNYNIVTRGVHVWMGGGLGVLFVSVDRGSDNTAGLNLEMGLGFPGGSVYPYFQFKGFLSGSSNAQVAFGLRL
jgi:hypothetical protein